MRRALGRGLQLVSILLAASFGVAGVAAAPRAAGDLLLFTTDRTVDGSREIHAISATGGREMRLTRHSPQGAGAAWSPNGGRIAFVASELDLLSSADAPVRWSRGDSVAVWTIDPGGRHPRRIRILDDPSGAKVLWSPDGRKLAVVSRGDVYVTRPDGSHVRRLSSEAVGVFDAAWAPDGRRLAVTGWRGDRLGAGMFIVNAESGQFRRVTRQQKKQEIEGEFLVSSPAWSPDGRRVAFLRESGWFRGDEYLSHLMVVHANGGPERRIARGQIYDARWAADGARIALITPRGVDIMRPDGGERRRLGDASGEEFALAWSRDGKQVLTASTSQSRTTLYVASLSKGGFQRLSARRVAGLHGVYGDQQWAPSGRAVVVTHAGDQHKEPLAYLQLVRVDGRRVPLLRPALDAAPAWSPTGRAFAFERLVGMRHTVHVASPDGSHDRSLGLGRRPRWAPDGRRIAFARRPWIVIAQPGGGPARRIARASDAFWSPDSASLAYAAAGSVWLVNRQSGVRRRLAGPEFPPYASCRKGWRLRELAWSPDGRLAFLASCNSEEGGPAAIYSVRADGRHLARIMEASGYEESLVWSPDGTRLAYEEFGVFTVKPDGSGRTRIADRADALAWSPDSRRLAFVRVRRGGKSGDHDIWVMNADGTKARPVTRRGNNLEPTWRPTARSS